VSIERTGLEEIDSSGASDGQVPVWNATDSVWEPGTISGGGSGTLPWFVVTDTAYGATGDGTTDDTAAIDAAIAALNTAGSGVLYFPAGTYKITADLATITAHCLILGDGAGDLQAQNAASTIRYDSATGTALTLAGDGIEVRGLALENSTALTHTAGAGIKVTQGDQNRYRNVSVRGFYDCVDIEDGALWEMHSCYLVGPKRYGLYVRHIDLVDGGDQVIVGGAIYAEDRDASAGIRQESGGGLRVLGTKVNSLFGTGYFAYGIDATITNAATTNLLLSGLSIENVATSCVRVTHTGTGSFGHIILQGVEMAQYQAGSTPAIDISNVSLVSLDGLIMVASPSRACESILLTSVTTAILGQRVQTGYASDYTATSSTGITDLMAAFDTTAEAERIRDVIGTALVEGSNVTITVDDAGNTITIAATGGASTHREVAMADFGSGLEPVTDASGDWLYGIYAGG
jgi:hypothetical protein